MKTVTRIDEARRELVEASRDGRSVGLVPTMGYLHDGHVSLMERSVRDNDLTMTTIFVNPLQFAEDEDLSDYPRDFERDSERCRNAGVGLLLAPSVEEMYPMRPLTTVSVGQLSQSMEGESRPTHFAGVATVVAKLFAIAGPCTAYFGEKDWQQLQIVRRMAADLSFPVDVVGCPIVREPDGLAMSSRNVYLDEEHRAAATVLSRSLRLASAAVNGGETDAAAIREVVRTEVAAQPLAELDYVAIVDDTSLEPVDEIRDGTHILMAARVGPARLIDNIDAYAGIELDL